MGIKAQKTKSYDSGRFNVTIEFHILMCNTIEGNNNKFYCIELQKDPKKNEFRLFTDYGRLNHSHIYEFREGYDNENSARKDMESIIKKKCRPKTKKNTAGDSYKEQYHKVEVAKPRVGSTNIREIIQASSSTNKVNIDITNITDPHIARVIRDVIAANIHNIKAVTTLKVTDNGLETPLGPLQNSTINEAREVLNELNKISVNDDGDFSTDEQKILDLNKVFFSLVPHPFHGKVTLADCINNAKTLENKFELLDQLESAVKMGSNLNSDVSNQLNILGIDFNLVTNEDTLKRLNDKLKNSRSYNHKHLHIWKIKRVFEVCIPEERTRFDKTLKSNKYKVPHQELQRGQHYNSKSIVQMDYNYTMDHMIMELWHGSRKQNILSILMNGLIIPPTSSSHVTGRMFGDGIYGATSCTKSLNYSLGYWGNSYNNDIDKSCYLLIADFNLGNIYQTDTSQCSGVPSGYDSIFARAGRNLQNEEVIVYDLSQQTIKYLVELEV